MRHKSENRYGHEKIKSMVNAYNIDAISMETERLRVKPSSYQKIAFDRAVQVL
jgi:hypothetical protein